MFVTFKEFSPVQITWPVKKKKKKPTSNSRFSAFFYVKNALKRKRGPQYKDQWSNGTLMVNNIKYIMSGRI